MDIFSRISMDGNNIIREARNFAGDNIIREARNFAGDNIIREARNFAGDNIIREARNFAGDNMIREARHFTARRYKPFPSSYAMPLRLLGSNLGVINEQPETTPLVTPATQRSLPLTPKKNERCLNAFLVFICYILGIGSLYLGGTYINDCPDQKMLPVSLIIFGGILVVARLLNCAYDCRCMFDERDSENTPLCIQALNAIFFLASFGTFMAVCYWTYSLDPTTKPEDRGLKNYCDSTFYYIATWGCILGIIFFVVPFLCGCCAGLCSICCSS